MDYKLLTNQVINELIKYHPFLSLINKKEQFYSYIKSLDNIEITNNYEFYYYMNSLFRFIGDSHTKIVPTKVGISSEKA
jgi:hypothetical protein